MTKDWRHKGYEGCDTPYDLGWKWGAELSEMDSPADKIHMEGLRLDKAEFDEFLDGWREAQRGWE